jgi:hypothetical protein
MVDDGLDYDSLIDTITTIVYPASWDDVGGPGAVSPLHRMLVVSQTDLVHDEISALLAEIRRVRKDRGDKVAANPVAGEAAQPQADPHAISVKIYKVAVPQSTLPRAALKPEGKSDKPTENLQQNVFGVQSGIPNDRYLEELARAIPALVRPETWERTGGAGTLYALPADMNFTGHLLVRQTGEVHAQIQKFLKELQPGGTAGGFGGGGGFF